MANPLGAEIETSAEGPMLIDRDGVRLQEHNLQDAIEANRHLAAIAAAAASATTAKVTGLRFRTLIPPGA